MSTSPPPSAPVRLTLLSSILGSDFPRALKRQQEVGITYLDLKDGLGGKKIEDLSEDESTWAATLIAAHGMRVHCFSTGIGHSPLKPGLTESEFRQDHDPALENVLVVARVLHPMVIRLLVPRLAHVPGEIAFFRMQREFPWVLPVYREWVDRILATGTGVLIENEAHECLFSSVADIQAFFTALDRPTVRYTWDIQNLWQTGTFPALDIYQQLKPWIGAVHLKGGQSGDDGRSLALASSLDTASWPVTEILRAVITDRVAPFICLNPSHGKQPPGWNPWDIAQQEIAWLRREFPEIE